MVNGKLVIETEPENKCEMCGQTAELRPYGPKGENVCYPCGMKDEAAAIRAFLQRLRGGH